MVRFITGLILGILLAPIAGYLYLRSGQAPVAATDPPLPMEEYLAHMALRARIRLNMPQATPPPANEATFRAGALVYRQYCADCHGLVNRPQSAIARGMFPEPPQLLEPHGMVTDDLAGVTFWKAKNGIRLSGMPGFHASLSDQQMWQVSVLLANADKLPADVKQELTSAPTATPPSGTSRVKK